jgi:hypothetical protein
VLGVFGVALAFLFADAGAAAGGAGREAAIDLGDVPDAGCPSAPALASALESRLPGITARRIASGTREPPLRMRVDGTDGGAVRFALVDGNGGAMLERTFAPAAAASVDRAASCAVLADTIALVVERYLRQLGYREPSLAAGAPAAVAIARSPEAPAPPAPPPPWRPRALVAAGVGVKPGGRWPTRTEPEVVVDVPAGRTVLSLAAAFTLPIETPVPTTDGGRFQFEALPLRAGVGFPLALPRRAGWLAPSALAGVDLFRGETRSIAMPAVVQGAAPAAELGVVAALRLGRLALRPYAFVCLRRERRFELSDPALAGVAVFADPAVAARFGADLAFVLDEVGKN